jgi:hypothetical protein
MLKFMTSGVVVFGLAALLAGSAHGQVKVTHRPAGGDFTGVYKKRPGSVQQPNFDVLGLLKVQSFYSYRAKSLRATITSNSIKPIKANYSILIWDGKHWKRIRSGLVNVPAKRSARVVVAIDRSTSTRYFKIELRNSEFRINLTRRCKVAGVKPTTYLVRYSTNGWVLVRDDKEGKDPNHLIGEPATAAAKTLRTYGFKTRLVINKNEIPFFESYRITLFVKTPQRIERTFNTKQEADDFTSALRRLVKPLHPGANGSPLTHLTVLVFKQ